jgi:prepilin-type N-terminal cleavage/methylation domain-containing protein
MKRTSGFTLIELLIVVAIIAILAAIAVPNFLEAQTRAKISRSYADMRSISVGLESYQTDWNRYPTGFINIREGAKIDPQRYPDPGMRRRSDQAMSRLTTPVAYMTSILIDPVSYGTYTWYRVDDGARGPISYWYEDFQYHDVFVGVKGVGGWVYKGMKTAHDWGYLWSLHSMGPRHRAVPSRFALEGRAPGDGPEGSEYFAYDATNGTVSHGLVMRTSKGHFKEVNQGKSP